jgi:hypothetical protein
VWHLFGLVLSDESAWQALSSGIIFCASGLQISIGDSTASREFELFLLRYAAGEDFTAWHEHEVFCLRRMIT